MACCVLMAAAIAALLALKRLTGGGVAADPRAWRLRTERSDD
jgi:hypothetical protein